MQRLDKATIGELIRSGYCPNCKFQMQKLEAPALDNIAYKCLNPDGFHITNRALKHWEDQKC